MTTLSTTEAALDKNSADARIAPWWHTILLIIALFGYAVIVSRPEHIAKVAALPNRVPMYLKGCAMEIGTFCYVWLGLRLRGVRARDIIGGRWNRASDFFKDFGIAMLFWVVVLSLFFSAYIVFKLDNREVAWLISPRTPRELIFYIPMAASAGFCEEFIFRGYLQRQFLAIFRRPSLAITAQAAIFGFVHLYQGRNNAIAICAYGLLFGVLAQWRKSLRPGMIQHFGEDLLVGVLVFAVIRYRML